MFVQTILKAQVLAFRNTTNVKLRALRQQVTELAPWSILQNPSGESLGKPQEDNLEVGPSNMNPSLIE